MRSFIFANQEKLKLIQALLMLKAEIFSLKFLETQVHLIPTCYCLTHNHLMLFCFQVPVDITPIFGVVEKVFGK